MTEPEIRALKRVALVASVLLSQLKLEFELDKPHRRLCVDMEQAESRLDWEDLDWELARYRVIQETCNEAADD